MKLGHFLLPLWGWEQGWKTEAKRPNVVLLLADDMGMGDISLNNANGKIHTPNIDSIGQQETG